MSGARARQNTPNSGGGGGVSLAQQNSNARAAILAQSVNMVQSIYSNTVANPGSSNNVLNISPRLVGFLKRFWVEISCTIQNTSAVNDLALTPFGPANILRQILFTDLSNNVRIQTTGWHLFFTSSLKRNRPYGAAFSNDCPVNMGNVYNTNQAAAVIPKGGTNTATLSWLVEVPITFNDTDFRGGIWLGVTNATANLQLTINPNPTVAAGGDPTNAVYIGDAGGTITSLTVNCYQNYLDQLPIVQGKVVLPFNDISTVYMLQNTVGLNTVVQNQDNPIPYANFRDFLSTIAVFDNGGVLNTGSDVSYWALQAANYVNMLKIDPLILSLWSRNMVQDDFPQGVYAFTHYHKPISTIQYGNQELILNPSTVNAGAQVLMGYEMFALVNLVAQAGALAIA
jgi:P3 major capsid protein